MVSGSGFGVMVFAGLAGSGCGLGSALWAMSPTNGVSRRMTSAGTSRPFGLAAVGSVPSTSTSSAVLALPSGPLVTSWGRPCGPGRNSPYGSVASIGMSSRSGSVRLMPSRVRDWILTCDQGAMPLSWGWPVGPTARFGSPSSLPVATGPPSSALPAMPSRPFVDFTYSRRNAWWHGCDVYVWLWSTHGLSVFFASCTSSAVPRTPSGPGWSLARVSTMNAWLSGTSSPVFGLPSGPRVRSGSSARSGTNTVPPLLNVWSTPWSKNWPKNVNSELYGGERPTSVVTSGMNRVLCSGTQSGGGRAVGAPQTNTPVLFCVRTGNPAAATAAGLVEVWSTIRLLIVRGSESTTSPRVEYDVRPLARVDPGWSGTGKEL